MRWPRSWPTLRVIGRPFPTSHYEHWGPCGLGQIHQTWERGVHYILWCKIPFDTCSCGLCHLHNQTKLGQDTQLHHRKIMSVHHITTLLSYISKYLFPLSSKVLWTDAWTSYGFPLQSNFSWPVHGIVWNQGHKYCHSPTKVVNQVPGGKFFNPKGRTQQPVSAAHQLHWPSYSIYCRDSQHRWIHFIFGHISFTGIWQYFVHYSLQKTYPHRPVPLLGQPPWPICKI